ncbi:MAG: DUF1707 domain-containing protein [Streptosporangiaceae bacterium]
MEPDDKQLAVRASDADRDRVVEAISAASAEGRLSPEESSQRIDAALVARTHGDLASLTTDLPAVPQGNAVAIPEEITAVLGNESRKGPWVVPPQLVVRSVLGDCHLEMQDAIIEQPVTIIDVTAKFGSVTIWVPDGTDVRMTGRAVLSAKSSELHGKPQPGAPVIVVHCDLFCSAVTVKLPDWKMRLRAKRDPDQAPFGWLLTRRNRSS